MADPRRWTCCKPAGRERPAQTNGRTQEDLIKTLARSVVPSLGPGGGGTLIGTNQHDPLAEMSADSCSPESSRQRLGTTVTELPEMRNHFPSLFAADRFAAVIAALLGGWGILVNSTLPLKHARGQTGPVSSSWLGWALTARTKEILRTWWAMPTPPTFRCHRQSKDHVAGSRDVHAMRPLGVTCV